MSDQKKPPNLDLPPGQRATGAGPRPPETPAGDPKEKGADAPATSENEQKAARGSKGAEDEKRNVEKRATTPEGQLHPTLQEIQARHAEAAPPGARLIKPGKEEGVPKPETPLAPLAKRGDLPRFVDQNERSPSGLTRFKIRVLNFGDQDTRYVLARDEAEAKGHYVKGMAIDRMVEAMGEGAPEPLFSCVKLAD